VDFDSLLAAQCNTRVTATARYFPGDAARKEVRGGGAKFQPEFDWVEDYGITPEVLLYSTDLRLPEAYTPKDPGYPAIWAKVPHDKPCLAPKFGETIKLD
jgi:hypothetical protein